MAQLPNHPITESLNHPRADCALCAQAGGEVLWDDSFARVVLIGDADHPAYCRVILNAHRKEMTDLAEAERARLMKTVFVVEQVLRELLEPEKINLASFGNMVPHLHWHVIPRFADDAHFPDPVWAARKRDGRAHAIELAALQKIFSERLPQVPNPP